MIIQTTKVTPETETEKTEGRARRREYGKEFRGPGLIIKTTKVTLTIETQKTEQRTKRRDGEAKKEEFAGPGLITDGKPE